MQPEILKSKVEIVGTVSAGARTDVINAQAAADEAVTALNLAQSRAREVTKSMPDALQEVLAALDGPDAVEFDFLTRVLDARSNNLRGEFEVANYILEALKTMAEHPFIAVSNETDHRVGRSIKILGANTVAMEHPIVAATEKSIGMIEYVIHDDENQASGFGIGHTRFSSSEMGQLFKAMRDSQVSDGFKIVSGYDKIAEEVASIKSVDMVAFLAIATGYEWPDGSLYEALSLSPEQKTELEEVLVSSMAKMYVGCGFKNCILATPARDMSVKARNISYKDSEKPYVGWLMCQSYGDKSIKRLRSIFGIDLEKLFDASMRQADVLLAELFGSANMVDGSVLKIVRQYVATGEDMEFDGLQFGRFLAADHVVGDDLFVPDRRSFR